MSNLLKKSSVSLFSVALVSVIASCSSGNLLEAGSFKGSTDFSGSNLSDVKLQQLITASTSNGEKVTVLDVGNGAKTGASFALKLNFGNGGFKTKASASGTSNKTVSTDLANLKVYLLDSITAPTGNFSALLGTGSTSPLLTVAKGASLTGTGTTQTVFFKNVKANSATGGTPRYYVAVAGFNSAGNNITNLTAPATDGTNGAFYVTTAGGNGTGSTAVGPAPTYTIASADLPSLSVTLNLADAIGATVASDVKVNDGLSADPIAVTAQ